VPLGTPGLAPVILERPFYRLPFQMARSLWIFLSEKWDARHRTVMCSSKKPADFFSPCDVTQHILPFDLEDIKTKTRDLDCSMTVLVLTALSISLSRSHERQAGETLTISIPVDLRPFFAEDAPVFGNFSNSCIIRIRRDLASEPQTLLQEVKRQLEKSIRSIEQKSLLFPKLIEKLFTLIGKKNFSRGLRMGKRKRLISLTCAVSNLGSLDRLNTHGVKSQVCEAINAFSTHGLLMVVSGIDKKIMINFSYPEAEFSRQEILTLIRLFEKEFGNLLTIE